LIPEGGDDRMRFYRKCRGKIQGIAIFGVEIMF
jgi:hypothetical protein